MRPYVAPCVVEAQSPYYPVHIEPRGVAMATCNGNSTYGRLVIDLRNGNVWAFPDIPLNSPPAGGVFERTLPTSHPVLLGKWALADMDT
jgi:hypothetical protein